MYVTVFQIPIVGGNGNIQSRSLVFDRPPPKEGAINTLMALHEESLRKESYVGEWERCANTLRQVPEELFARMSQRRTRNITHLVSVVTHDGVTQRRLFSARSCFVHDGSGQE